ncbi:MAG: Holliday junction resolvase [Candidatus Poseidoniales archaeon]
MGVNYERELRSVLAGELKGVRAVTRSCTELERAQTMQVMKRPFLVVRAPGSGSEGTGDLLVLRGDMCFPIEVKSSKENKLYLSGRTVHQYNALKEVGERCNLMPLYAYRLKRVRGDSWRIMRVEGGNLTGKLRKLSRKIPTLPLTRNGTPYLGWDKGMPLNRFIALVCGSDNLNNIEKPLSEYSTDISTLIES